MRRAATSGLRKGPHLAARAAAALPERGVKAPSSPGRGLPVGVPDGKCHRRLRGVPSRATLSDPTPGGRRATPLVHPSAAASPHPSVSCSSLGTAGHCGVRGVSLPLGLAGGT